MDLRLRVPRVLHGRICLPASKSVSNRMLLLRVLSRGAIRLRNVSDCDDTRAMEEGVRKELKNERIEKLKSNLKSQTSNFKSQISTVDVGAAGTAMRFLTAYFASTPCEVVITGTERMRHRPIGVLVEALRSLGAEIGYEGEEGFPPLHIKGRQLEGGSISMSGGVSSQFVSALLMVAPTMRQGLTLRLEGDIISRPYIDITTGLMRRFGATVEEPDDRTFRVAPGDYTGGDFLIENDWSAASYWYELLALADEGEIVLEGLFEDSLQGDSCVRQLFEPLGVSTVFNEEGAVIRKELKNEKVEKLNFNPQSSMLNVQSYEADLSHCPDLAQTMVATCCGMGVPFCFSGLQSLRIKETDRLLALRQELGKLGYDVRETEDSLELKNERIEKLNFKFQTSNLKSQTSNLSIDTYDDHRMAMCMAPLAMLHEGLVINDAQVVSKSYPTFWDDLKSVGCEIEEL